MVAQKTRKTSGPKVTKTYKEINERIMKGQAVVLTAEEMIHLVEEKGAVKAAGEVDVVTTGTFGPMCSSGAFLNFGHASPRIRAHRVWLNNVAAYGGIAAVDTYLGATELPEDDPMNKVFPGRFPYGGGHVIHDLVAGKEILDWRHVNDDAVYLKGLRAFTKMFRTGVEPIAEPRMLAPLAALEAMEKSLARKTAVKVGKVE